MKMKMKIFLFIFVYTPSINSINNIYSTKIEIKCRCRFEVPVDIHLISSLTNIGSLMMCGILCDRHTICRTADHDSTQQICRLFETSFSAGTSLNDLTTSILALNYCTNDNEREAEYVCTRSGSFTVQDIFDKLSLSPTITLSSTDRGVYANMYGVYTSSSAGQLSFFTYTGVKTILENLSSEVTNINLVPLNGLSIVQYYNNFSIIYQNVGNSSFPNLVPIVSIVLPGKPYSCFTTLNYHYIAYVDSQLIMTIDNRSTESILYTVTSSSFVMYRPVVTQWNDTIVVLDQCQSIEYTLTGVYKGNWTYVNGFESCVRNYIHYDYAGRRYICNYLGTNPGIYAFLQNGTAIANGPGNYYRAFQLYLTKDQSMLINTPPSGATMQIINFKFVRKIIEEN